MIDTAPVYMGQFDAMVAGSVFERYLDVTDELAVGRSISTVAFTVRDAAGATVAGVVTSNTPGGGRVDFRGTLPATAGWYELSAFFTLDDAQTFTRTAGIWVVK